MKADQSLSRGSIPKKVIWFALKAVVSVSLMILAFSSTPTTNAMDVLKAIPVWAWLLGTSLLVIQLPMISWRWSVILKCSDIEIDFRDATRFTFIGYFFNQALPSSVGGDFMRAFLAWKDGVDFQMSLVSVLVERATGLFILGLFSMLLLLEQPFPVFRNYTQINLVLLVVILSLVGLAFLMLLNKLAEKSPDSGRVVRFLGLMGSQFFNLVARRRSLMAVIALGFTSSLIGLTSIQVASLSLELSISYAQLLGVAALAIAASVLPVSIAGWGVRENMMIWLMTPLGVSAENALGLSIWFGLVSLIAAIPGGILWLKSR